MLENVDIRVVSTNRRDQGSLSVADACINVECGFGEECRGGKCVCSYQCPSSPPSSARVCGEDGVLYISDCHRQLAACRRATPIPAMPLTHCHSAVATTNGSSFGCPSPDRRPFSSFPFSRRMLLSQPWVVWNQLRQKWHLQVSFV